jgi:hypothetical protein
VPKGSRWAKAEAIGKLQDAYTHSLWVTPFYFWNTPTEVMLTRRPIWQAGVKVRCLKNHQLYSYIKVQNVKDDMRVLSMYAS